MKSILISIKPRFVADILNGKKTIEIRKTCPKNFKGWVYIYCTKARPYLYRVNDDDLFELCDLRKPHCEEVWEKDYNELNGKVVARFWCDEVEEIERRRLFDEPFLPSYRCKGEETKYSFYSVQVRACLSAEEVDRYLKNKGGYAIHISKLEIFDKPKEVGDFFHAKYKRFDDFNGHYNEFCVGNKLTRAPQSWGYVEV